MIADPVLIASRAGDFLQQSAALVVAFTLVPSTAVAAQQPAPAPPLPGSLQHNRMLDGWLRDQRRRHGDGVHRQGRAGPGHRHGAGADRRRRARRRPRAHRHGLGRHRRARRTKASPSGSLSIEHSGTALRFAAAEAREILLDGRGGEARRAAADDLKVDDGTVAAPDGAAHDVLGSRGRCDLLQREATAKAKPKPASQHQSRSARACRGATFPRKSPAARPTCRTCACPACCSAASCARRPIARNSLALDDARGAPACPGVVAVVRDGNFLGGRRRARGTGDRRRAGAAQAREVAGDGGPAAVGRGAVRAHEARARVDSVVSEKPTPRPRPRRSSAARSELHAAVPGARVDRPVVRRRAMEGRQAAPSGATRRACFRCAATSRRRWRFRPRHRA